VPVVSGRQPAPPPRTNSQRASVVQN
jgi:hypothetical protein